MATNLEFITKQSITTLANNFQITIVLVISMMFIKLLFLN